MIVPFATTMLLGKSGRCTFRDDILAGLSCVPKQLPCKYFYNRRGSKLFERICDQPEYYLTRTEHQIMQSHSAEMAAALGPRVHLIEFGSGSSVKTRYLLNQLPDSAVYVPVDISREHLLKTAEQLRHEFPKLKIRPLCADFTARVKLPTAGFSDIRRVVYFPGSTIGNFERPAAARLLRRIGRLCGAGGGLLIGIDLVKDREIIERAYNDEAGVTAKFNLNLLRRINRELGANFRLGNFQHLAFYDVRCERVELRLVSQCHQQVRVAERTISFEAGEAIRTEYSHKYTIDGFARLARDAGWRHNHGWTDANRHFGVLYFVNTGHPKQNES